MTINVIFMEVYSGKISETCLGIAMSATFNK